MSTAERRHPMTFCVKHQTGGRLAHGFPSPWVQHAQHLQYMHLSLMVIVALNMEHDMGGSHWGQAADARKGSATARCCRTLATALDRCLNGAAVTVPSLPHSIGAAVAACHCAIPRFAASWSDQRRLQLRWPVAELPRSGGDEVQHDSRPMGAACEPR